MQCKEQTKVVLMSSARLANGCLVTYSLVNLTFAYIRVKFERIISTALIRFCFPVTQLFGQAVARPPTLPLDPSRKGAVTNSLLCIFQTITVRNASQCVPALITDTRIFECTAVIPDTVRTVTCTKTHISNVLCLNVCGGGGVCSQSIT